MKPPDPHLLKAFADLGIASSPTVKPRQITKGDEEALARMPAGDWFTPESLPHTVRNAVWRCQRLEAQGKLESRVVGKVPDLKTEWKKLS